jgi:hypothetical protein
MERRTPTPVEQIFRGQRTLRAVSGEPMLGLFLHRSIQSTVRDVCAVRNMMPRSLLRLALNLSLLTLKLAARVSLKRSSGSSMPPPFGFAPSATPEL